MAQVTFHLLVKIKNMQWLKKYWKDTTFKTMILCILIGAAVFQVGIWMWDREINNPLYLELAIGFLLVIVLPLSYLQRNNP